MLCDHFHGALIAMTIFFTSLGWIIGIVVFILGVEKGKNDHM